MIKVQFEQNVGNVVGDLGRLLKREERGNVFVLFNEGSCEVSLFVLNVNRFSNTREI